MVSFDCIFAVKTKRGDIAPFTIFLHRSLHKFPCKAQRDLLGFRMQSDALWVADAATNEIFDSECFMFTSTRWNLACFVKSIAFGLNVLKTDREQIRLNCCIKKSIRSKQLSSRKPVFTNWNQDSWQRHLHDTWIFQRVPFHQPMLWRQQEVRETVPETDTEPGTPPGPEHRLRAGSSWRWGSACTSQPRTCRTFSTENSRTLSPWHSTRRFQVGFASFLWRAVRLLYTYTNVYTGGRRPAEFEPVNKFAACMQAESATNEQKFQKKSWNTADQEDRAMNLCCWQTNSVLSFVSSGENAQYSLSEGEHFRRSILVHVEPRKRQRRCQVRQLTAKPCMFLRTIWQDQFKYLFQTLSLGIQKYIYRC